MMLDSRPKQRLLAIINKGHGTTNDLLCELLMEVRTSKAKITKLEEDVKTLFDRGGCEDSL